MNNERKYKAPVWDNAPAIAPHVNLTGTDSSEYPSRELPYKYLDAIPIEVQ